MPRGDAPRLRVIDGGALARAVGGSPAGGRLRVLDDPPPGDDGSWSEGFDWRAELELVAPDITLPPGCSRAAVTAAEGSLGLTLPPQQVEFLTATDGVYDGDSHYWYAWSLERVVDENFDPDRPADLLAVGDDAGRGWFCVPLEGTGALHYDRVTGVRRTLARDLRGLWLGWFGGTLGV
jgi:hypothetical protein